jgi:hypothetical protein
MSGGAMDQENIPLGQIRKFLAQTGYDIAISAKDGSSTVEESCEALYALQELKRDLGMVIDDLEEIIAAQMEESIIFLPSGQQVEKRVGADRKAWDHKGLAEIVAERVYQSSVDMETGEVLLSPKEMMTKMLDYAAPSYWRIKELDKIGISTDPFCEKSEGRTSIIISRKKD